MNTLWLPATPVVKQIAVPDSPFHELSRLSRAELLQTRDLPAAALYAVVRQADQEERTLRSVDLRFGDRVAIQ